MGTQPISLRVKSLAIITLCVGAMSIGLGRASAPPGGPQSGAHGADSAAKKAVPIGQRPSRIARHTNSVARTGTIPSGGWRIFEPIVVDYRDDEATRTREAGLLSSLLKKAGWHGVCSVVFGIV